MRLLLVLALVALVCFFLFLRTPPKQLAAMVHRLGPMAVAGLGVVVLLFGRFAMALGLWGAAYALRQWLGPAASAGATAGVSSVRSAALEMELDHDTGAMNGLVLVGRFEGQVLDEMEEADLLALREEVEADAESLALLDAYLDRRFPGRAEAGEGDVGAGEAGAPGAGPMDQKQAYEILGLAPGATTTEIREAHRRLMKRAHPDNGGSTFLAAKVNEAKDVLLRDHS